MALPGLIWGVSCGMPSFHKEEGKDIFFESKELLHEGVFKRHSIKEKREERVA